MTSQTKSGLPSVWAYTARASPGGSARSAMRSTRRRTSSGVRPSQMHPLDRARRRITAMARASGWAGRPRCPVGADDEEPRRRPGDGSDGREGRASRGRRPGGPPAPAAGGTRRPPSEEGGDALKQPVARVHRVGGRVPAAGPGAGRGAPGRGAPGRPLRGRGFARGPPGPGRARRRAAPQRMGGTERRAPRRRRTARSVRGRPARRPRPPDPRQRAVLPIPGSPATSTTPPRRAAAASKAPCSRRSSCARPTNGIDLARPCVSPRMTVSTPRRCPDQRSMYSVRPRSGGSVLAGPKRATGAPERRRW